MPTPDLQPSPASRALAAEVTKKVRERGIVVWVDAEQEAEKVDRDLAGRSAQDRKLGGRLVTACSRETAVGEHLDATLRASAAR